MSPCRALLRASLVAAAAGAVALPASAAAAPPGWLTAWSASQSDPGPISSVVTDFPGTDGLTVRNVVRPTAAGKTIRIRLTNQFGTQPLTFDDVRVALAGEGAAIDGGSSRGVRFDGKPTVTIPPGGSALSDPIRRSVRYGQRLAVSVYSSGPTGNVTTSGAVQHTNYISTAGDHTGDGDGTAFTATNHWYFVAGMDVQPSRPSGGGVVALGSSSTLGIGSTPDAYRDWPSRLADAFHARFPAVAMPVLNAGVSGNTLHESSPCFGLNQLARLKRDALSASGGNVLITDIGRNDIIQPVQPHTGFLGQCNARTPISAADIIRLYKQVIARAHSAGMEVIGATIYPFGAFQYATPETDAERREVNDWVRKTPLLDGVLDYDKALADPADSSLLNPIYDSGDGLHPNDAGYAAEVAAINLKLFKPQR